MDSLSILNPTKLKKTLLISTLLLAACSPTEPPLNPMIGDTGQELSQTALNADVIKYDLELEIFPEDKSIKGIGRSEFLLINDSQYVELKLDSRFDIEKIIVNEHNSDFTRNGGILLIDLGNKDRA